jgi:hypothetical protein
MTYALRPDTSHLEEEGVFDAETIEYDGWEYVTFHEPTIDYQRDQGAPEVIEFVGNLENAARFDYLLTSPLGLLLLTKRMVRVLEAVGPFRHRSIPTVIYSNGIKRLVRDRFTRQRTWYSVTDPTQKNEDFVILQLLEETDCMDRERTLVKGVPFRESGATLLGRDDAQPLVLQPPSGGFPPVFCVPELAFYCFTEEARQACEHAGLKGLRWKPQR